MRALLLLLLSLTFVAANYGGVERENPFGACHCNDELWIAEDCKTGYICDGQEIRIQEMLNTKCETFVWDSKFPL